MKKKLIVFIDSGDTIVDESTEIRDSREDVVEADLFEGAREMLLQLHEEGYRIALVADGTTISFRNVYRQHGLEHVFEEWIISQELDAAKPDAIMFETAMERMGLGEADKERIVMIGNNLERDVVGANRMGITSILESLTPRYRMQPETPEEVPDYVVACPGEIPPLLEMLERQLKNRAILSRKQVAKR